MVSWGVRAVRVGGASALRRPAGRGAVGDTFQTFAAVSIVIVCVGCVLAAVQTASSRAYDDAARDRAHLQGIMVLDALSTDPALTSGEGTLRWHAAEGVANGLEPLRLKPATLAVLTLRQAGAGGEIFLVGNSTLLSTDLAFESRPVPIELTDGSVVPGVARAGVLVR